MRISSNKIIGIAACALGVAALFFGAWRLGLHTYFNIEHLKEHRGVLEQWVARSYAVSVCAYIALYISIVTLCLPAAAFMTLAGGFLFGTFTGALYANIGATVGSTIAFLCVRQWWGQYIQHRYAQELAAFNHEMKVRGVSYLLIIHLIAVVPLFVINILAGLTRVRVWTFVWTTSVGVLPSALIYTSTGQQMAQISSGRDLLNYKMILLLLCLLLLAAAPIFLQKRR